MSADGGKRVTMERTFLSGEFGFPPRFCSPLGSVERMIYDLYLLWAHYPSLFVCSAHLPDDEDHKQ